MVRNILRYCYKCKSPYIMGNYIDKNGNNICISCYYKFESNYMNKILDKNSNIGKGFIGQRVVAKTLGISIENDCNCSRGFNSNYDLYNKEYGKIDVKTSKLNIKFNRWYFKCNNINNADTYICLGFNNERNNIEHVWIFPNNNEVLNKRSICITNVYNSLLNNEHFEINIKPYNNMLHQMSQKRKETNGKGCILSNKDLK